MREKGALPTLKRMFSGSLMDAKTIVFEVVFVFLFKPTACVSPIEKHRSPNHFFADLEFEQSYLELLGL